MNFTLTTDNPARHKSDAVVIGVHSSRALTPSAEAVERASRGQLSALLKLSPLSGKVGDAVTLYGLRGMKAQRVVVIGCGPKRGLSTRDADRLLAKAVAQLNASGAASAGVYLQDLTVRDQADGWLTTRIVHAFADGCYRFDETKSRAKRSPRPKLRRVQIALSDEASTPQFEEQVRIASGLASGVAVARDLGNRPGNICTPSYLAQHARELGASHDRLTTTVLEEADMQRLGMGSLLSVAAGSREPAKLIIMDYRGGQSTEPPVALVGKGVTFDSGGISIKPSGSMDEMKFDMCGAASVFGVMHALAELSLPINVVGVVPATENLPDGQASKPGDIVTSMSGQTVEILNTDAEGRLILCDALTYVERYKPAVVIDIATLTGACVIALGSHASGLFSNDDDLANALLTASERSADRIWRLPLWPEYDEQLKSNFADMANVGGREGGAITAASFLARFCSNLRWAHLDIAGAAWKSGKSKGATGRPVPLLFRFLLDRLASASE